MGCGVKCAQILLVIFNIIFFLAGAGLLGIGIWLRVDPAILAKFNVIAAAGNNLFEYACYVLIAFGAFVLIISFCGCCGAWKKSTVLLGIYIFLVVIVILGQIAGVVMGFVFRNAIEKTVRVEVAKAIQTQPYAVGNFNNLTYTAFGSGMNVLQKELKCCGIGNETDYLPAQMMPLFEQNYPYACCSNAKGSMEMPIKPVGACTLYQTSVVAGKLPQTQGCEKGFREFIDQNIIIIIGVAIAVACLEIFGLIFGVCVCRLGRDEYDN